MLLTVVVKQNATFGVTTTTTCCLQRATRLLLLSRRPRLQKHIARRICKDRLILHILTLTRRTLEYLFVCLLLPIRSNASESILHYTLLKNLVHYIRHIYSCLCSLPHSILYYMLLEFSVCVCVYMCMCVLFPLFISCYLMHTAALSKYGGLQLRRQCKAALLFAIVNSHQQKAVSVYRTELLPSSFCSLAA
jgi:hypothetical protein